MEAVKPGSEPSLCGFRAQESRKDLPGWGCGICRFPKVISGDTSGAGERVTCGYIPGGKGKGMGLPAGPVVKNPPPNAADMGSSLVGELRSHMLWDNSKPTHTTGQFPHDSVEILHAAAETQHSQTHSDNNNKRAEGKEKAWNA